MSVILQYIIVSAIVATALGYTFYKVYSRFNKKSGPSTTECSPNACEGCDGCALKQELREKSCPKDLFPPK